MHHVSNWTKNNIEQSLTIFFPWVLVGRQVASLSLFYLYYCTLAVATLRWESLKQFFVHTAQLCNQLVSCCIPAQYDLDSFMRWGLRMKTFGQQDRDNLVLVGMTEIKYWYESAITIFSSNLLETGFSLLLFSSRISCKNYFSKNNIHIYKTNSLHWL